MGRWNNEARKLAERWAKQPAYLRAQIAIGYIAEALESGDHPRGKLARIAAAVQALELIGKE